jgi:hypothetical protein
MGQKNNLRLSMFIFTLVTFIFACPAFAEIKVFEKEVEAIVGEGQSQSQVESYALQRAKRLAVEEAGTYLSSLSVVQNYQLQKDEVTALASGIVRTVPVGLASVREANGVYYVKIKAKIEVDTSILDRQIQDIMKEKGTLKELENERKKNKELEEKLANLKSSDAKRIEEWNTQAMALEKERDRQNLLREEQSLKARGDMSKSEAERFAKLREIQEKTSQTLAEQEKTKREEAATLAAEQDGLKRAQLENEQRWNDMARKSQLAQDQWRVIDDSLSLKQALTEVTDLKREIVNLKSRLDFQYGENTKNLKAAYNQQRNLTTAKLPPAPVPKDDFESTAEYNRRISAYEQHVRSAQRNTGEAVDMLKKEEILKLAEAKVDYLGQQIRVLAPFVKRLRDLQARKFTLPEGGAMTVELDKPEADNNRFPLHLQYKGKSWSNYWKYNDREMAKDFYKTRTYLKAEGLFQIEEAAQLRPKLTAAMVTHPGTKETREFSLETPRTLTEIEQFAQFQQEEATAQASRRKAAHLLARKDIGKDGRFIAYDDGTVLDTRTSLMWAAKDNGSDIKWANAKSYCENYRGGGYSDWRMPTQDELAGLYDRSKSYKATQLHYNIYLTEFIKLSTCCPWASETRGSEAAVFNFLYGYRYWYPPVPRLRRPGSPGAVRQIDYLVI